LPPDDVEVELLKCIFSIKQNGSREQVKLVKRVASGDRPCFVKASGVRIHAVQHDDRSLVFDQVPSDPDPEQGEWYNF
jgi:hypothetical protein